MSCSARSNRPNSFSSKELAVKTFSPSPVRSRFKTAPSKGWPSSGGNFFINCLISFSVVFLKSKRGFSFLIISRPCLTLWRTEPSVPVVSFFVSESARTKVPRGDGRLVSLSSGSNLIQSSPPLAEVKWSICPPGSLNSSTSAR